MFFKLFFLPEERFRFHPVSEYNLAEVYVYIPL